MFSSRSNSFDSVNVRIDELHCKVSVVELQDRPGELVEDWHDLVVAAEGEVGVVQGALYCTELYCTVL